MNKSKVLPHQNTIMGICFMLLHTISLSIIYAVVKLLTKDMDSNLVVFLYKFMILIFALPWCLASGFSGLKTDKIWLHASRGLFSTLGSLCIFYAIKHIGLGDVTAVTKLEQIALLIIGVVYFREKITKTKIAVILISIFGAMMIIRPDLFISTANHDDSQLSGFNEYYIFVFLTILFWSINSTVIKVLGKTEKTKVQLFYVMFFSCIIAFPASFMHWELYTTIWVVEIKYPSYFTGLPLDTVKPEHMKYIALLALCYFGHVVGYFKAFKHAELSVVVPLEYSRLVFAGILGYIFFSEVPMKISLLGYALIIIGGLFLIKSEHKKAKRRRLNALESQGDAS